MINTNDELKSTYEAYQGIINSIQNKDIEKFNKISNKMKQALKLYKENIQKTHLNMMLTTHYKRIIFIISINQFVYQIYCLSTLFDKKIKYDIILHAKKGVL